MLAWFALLVVAAIGGVIAAFGVPADLAGNAASGVTDIVRVAALIVCICAALFLSLRDNASLAFRQASLWMALCLAGASLYIYSDDLLALGGRAAGDFLPAASVAEETQTETYNGGRRMVAIRAGANGQFDVDTLINGTHVSMLADTGATFVTLSYDDARRIGFDVNALDYNIPLRTANGVAHGAVIEIDEVEVGGILVRRVPAIVSQPDMLHMSLLGMSYFREIGSFQVSGDQLVLQE